MDFKDLTSKAQEAMQSQEFQDAANNVINQFQEASERKKERERKGTIFHKKIKLGSITFGKKN